LKTEGIRTAACPRCYLCGSEGQPCHAGLEDILYSAPGRWDFKRCPNKQCGLIWLDPMPLTEDLPKAYGNYYTHAPLPKHQPGGWLKGLYRGAKERHLESALGYDGAPKGRLTHALAKALCLVPGWSRRMEAEAMFLRARRGARLLDVGCGSGDWLAAMRARGWEVVGVDFDQAAVETARARGIEAHCGQLTDCGFPSQSFEAITLSHVIEHVPDPVALLVECRRLLHDEGTLVLTTPNGSSLGHRLFQRHWRGLEPPRHLRLLSVPSTSRLLGRAGLSALAVRTVGSAYIWHYSLRSWVGSLRSTLNGRAGSGLVSLAKILNLHEELCLRLAPGAGECLVAVAGKGGPWAGGVETVGRAS
jgi:SAM-dependent methyltransferase